MSKQSHEHTEMLDMLRVVDEAGPLTASDMVGDFKGLVKRGLISADGNLSPTGKQMLAEVDRAP